jgi:hypothetical protein
VPVSFEHDYEFSGGVLVIQATINQLLKNYVAHTSYLIYILEKYKRTYLLVCFLNYCRTAAILQVI